MLPLKQRGGEILSLIISLYKIKKSHTKNHKIYQQTIQIFPQLKYPKLDACKDYNESLKYKLHLSYLLGNALIEADKNWYKGGYLKLLSKIEKAKARHRAIQEVVRIIPKEKQEIIYCIELENRVQINCEKINRIFQAHKDYQPIIDNILHNFSYFLENFSEIESWLLSGEFHKRYKKEKHPYPSLINPKMADYKNISAQLAWEMNLPLPENYDFIFFVVFGAGSAAMCSFLSQSVIMNPRIGNPYQQYLASYLSLMQNMHNVDKKRVIVLDGRKVDNNDVKFYLMITKKVPALCVVRDPISVLRPIINHIVHSKLSNPTILKEFDFCTEMNKIFEAQIPYQHPIDKHSNKPSIRRALTWFVDKVDNHYILNHRIKTLKRVLLEVYYIDMLDILPNKAHDTLVYLAKTFNYSPPKQNAIFERAHNSIIVNISRVFFPKVFNVYLNDKNIKINLALKNNILEDKYVNCIEEFTQSLLLLGENVGAGAYILKSDFDELRAKHEIWNKVKKYLGEYFMRLEQRYMLEQERIVFENEILDFFRDDGNRDILIKYKMKFDEDLEHIKRYRPDIVESWEYYQEFLKICEEKGI